MMMEVHSEVSSEGHEAIERMIDECSVAHRAQGLGQQLGEGVQPPTQTGSQNDPDQIGSKFFVARCGRGFHP